MGSDRGLSEISKIREYTMTTELNPRNGQRTENMDRLMLAVAPAMNPQDEEAPIFTNAEANKIISMEARKIEGFREADAEFMDAALDTEAEDYEKIGGRLNKAAIKVVNMISPIVDKVQRRRWKGYEIAYREWVERGEKEGAEPDPWSGVYNLPILVYYNYLYH